MPAPQGRKKGRMKVQHDESTFTLTGEYWSATYPLADLQKWLAFYRGRRARFPKAGDAYDTTLAALEELERRLSAASGAK